jgi:hypothetical protein
VAAFEKEKQRRSTALRGRRRRAVITLTALQNAAARGGRALPPPTVSLFVEPLPGRVIPMRAHPRPRRRPSRRPHRTPKSGAQAGASASARPAGEASAERDGPPPRRKPEPGIGRGEVMSRMRRSSFRTWRAGDVSRTRPWASPPRSRRLSSKAHELRAVARFDSPRRAGLRRRVRGSGDPRAVQRYGVDRMCEILESKRGWPRCPREVRVAR